MNKLTIFLTFSFSLLIFNCATAQKYYPLVDTNKLWCMEGINIISGGMDSGSYYIKFSKDTTIKGIVYKKVMLSYSLVNNKWINDGYIRETADKKVYYSGINDVGSIIGTYLLYNFNVKKGDINILQSSIFNFSVDSIDSISIGNQFRKRFFLHDSSGVYNQEIWIEGIGSLCGVLTVGECQMIGNENYLLCCSENDTLLYGNPEHNYCYQGKVNIKENRENNFIDIFPNPASDILNIEFNSASQQFNKSTTFTLYNIIGQQINSAKFNSTDTRINTSALNDGLYILKLTGNTSTTTRKIIIKH